MCYYTRRLSHVISAGKVLDTEKHTHIVIFSDCHRGDGSRGDSFLNNKAIYSAALSHYLNSGFTYIELGDGDELWENRHPENIIDMHGDIFQLLQSFQINGKLFMLKGNHDYSKGAGNYCKPGIWFCPPVFESITLPYPTMDMSYHLIHGHQADFFNDRLWKLARWLVRYLWRPLELAGFNDPTSAAKNYEKKKLCERRMARWVEQNKESIISGHTHRPTIAPDTRKPGYYNAGSCVHPGGITCIELVYGVPTLVKWTTCADENMYLYICRREIH